jgi:hypothetical protein
MLADDKAAVRAGGWLGEQERDEPAPAAPEEVHRALLRGRSAFGPMLALDRAFVAGGEA